MIGVLLTGLLDDGTAGLWAIKDRGGVAIVQSPDEAAYPEMPLNAIRHVEVDHRLGIADMANVLRQLTTEELALQEVAMSNDDMKTEIRIARGDSDYRSDFARLGQPSSFTCPECHGSMRRIEEGSNRRFRCHTGHAFGEATLESEQSKSIELTLTQALALIEEQEMLLQDVASTAKADRRDSDADEHLSRATEVRQVGARLRELIDEVTPKS